MIQKKEKKILSFSLPNYLHLYLRFRVYFLFGGILINLYRQKKKKRKNRLKKEKLKKKKRESDKKNKKKNEKKKKKKIEKGLFV